MSGETTTRYWCHVCNIEVSIYMAPDPTCQTCNEQFIEELQSDDDPRTFLAGQETENASALPRSFFTTEGGNNTQFFSMNANSTPRGDMGDDIFQFFGPTRSTDETTDGQQQPQTPQGQNVNHMMQGLLASLMNVPQNQENPTQSAEAGNPRPFFLYGNMVNGNFRFQSGNQDPTQTSPTEGEPNPTNNTNDARGNVANSILQFLSAMTGGSLGEGLAGNPNDYAFSQTALDNIITQLMEQTGGGSAPPPASEQVIESLPKRELSEKEKSQEADCAVCKDTFEKTEQVIQLPCEHIFHDDCIRPWLKLNSTCPVCRKSVLPENSTQDQPTQQDLDLD